MATVVRCAECGGFTKLFAQEPRKIPIGAKHGTELVESAGQGPYR